MPTRPLSRRTVLRGLFAGSAVSLSLPPLEAFFNTSGNAYAAGGSFPCRFGLYFWGNGTLPDRWVPVDTGEDYTLSPELEPLANVKQHVAVITGTEVKLPNVIAHGSGVAGILTGMPLLGTGDDTTFAGPSLDQILGDKLGDATRFRTLEVGVQPGVEGRSFNGPDSRNPPEYDPAKLFERLFGPTFRAPGEGGVVDPRLGLRRSILDAVMTDAESLKGRLGATDKVRLDQHLDAVRDLEKRIARLQEDPPDLAACVRPEAPAAVPDIDGRPQMDARAKVIADLAVMAMACDQTRVLSMWQSDPLSDVLYPDTNGGHHQLTHDEPGDQPQVHEIVRSCVASYAYLVEAMASVQEGDGTLLDHSVVLGTSDVSYGRTHQIDEYPILIAGTAGGTLKNGFHYRSETKENAGQVSLTLLRAMGLAVGEFGVDDAATDKTLSALEV